MSDAADMGGTTPGLVREPDEAISVFRRFMELPRYLRVVRSSEALTAMVREICAELGFDSLTVASGPGFTRGPAEELARTLHAEALQVRGNSTADVAALAEAQRLAGADALVAIGGGRTIDVAKSACERLGRPVVVVPTQLTADGIASPVAVIRGESGAFESRHARLPIAVVVDMDLIEQAPADRARAGLGDLLANPCALRDWRRAAAAGSEGEVDDFAALLSQVAADLVYATNTMTLGSGDPAPALLERLLSGLVLSGLAMEIAGSSRPCSGSEHLISHALDQRHPGTASHGEQVAFGTLVCTLLQGEDWRPARECMAAAGMERALEGFGLGTEDLAAVVRAAPTTRPGRYTVLDEVEPSDDVLRFAIDEVRG
jgi:glycerol-1-phosphate dehydrogenase [NAD(P)+]